MTAKFDAFKAALDALCKAHGVRMYEEWDYDDCQHVYIEEAGEESAAGLDADIQCIIPPIPPTPEELAAAAAAKAEWEAGAAQREAEYQARMDAWRALQEKQQAARIQSPEYLALQARIKAQAEEQRKKNMRVTRIPGDHNDIGDKPCRVYCNEVEIEGWTVADDFRRVVETPGKVHHGAVRIDLEGHEIVEPIDTPAPLPSNSLSGIFVPVPKPVAPAAETAEAEPAPAPAPTFAPPAVKAVQKHIPARKRKASK